jgi:hypothetical protein
LIEAAARYAATGIFATPQASFSGRSQLAIADFV